MPYLAYRIHQYNVNADIKGYNKINLQGFMVGNGATHWDYDTTPSYLPMAYMHNLMSKETHEVFTKNDCMWYFNDVKPSKTNKECEDAMDSF